jgi:hypothetical protein
MIKEEQNPLKSNNALENYNNSSPSLTGDLLFQQRIDRCLVAYHSAKEYSTLYCSASSLFIDLAFCLSPEEEKNIQEILDKCYNLIPRAMDGKYESISSILRLTHKIMIFLTKKAHKEGFILQIKPKNTGVKVR